MVHKSAEKRPTAKMLLNHPFLIPEGFKTKAQLQKELDVEKFRNVVLSQKLEEAALCLKNSKPEVVVRSDKVLKASKKFYRSKSLTVF